MFAKKFQAFTQVVGCVTIGLLAVYGLVTLAGGAPALATAAESLGLKAAEAPVIPSTFNYQGLLRNPDGSLMTGAYTITAQVYGAAAAGSVLYTETFPNVTVREGVFNIVLGDDPQGQDLQSVFSATPRYIGITLVGQGEELIPRQRLHGVPWALYATNASQANDFTVSGTITATNATIGSATVTTATLGTATIDSATVTTATLGAATIGRATVNGDIRANGNITVSGNISWTGHLAGLKLSDAFPAETWDGGGDIYTSMRPITNSLCFLTRVESQSVDDNEWANCHIQIDNDGNWQLKTSSRSDGLTNAIAKCEARCLQW